MVNTPVGTLVLLVVLVALVHHGRAVESPPWLYTGIANHRVPNPWNTQPTIFDANSHITSLGLNHVASPDTHPLSTTNFTVSWDGEDTHVDGPGIHLPTAVAIATRNVSSLSDRQTQYVAAGQIIAAVFDICKAEPGAFCAVVAVTPHTHHCPTQNRQTVTVTTYSSHTHVAPVEGIHGDAPTQLCANSDAQTLLTIPWTLTHLVSEVHGCRWKPDTPTHGYGFDVLHAVHNPTLYETLCTYNATDACDAADVQWPNTSTVAVQGQRPKTLCSRPAAQKPPNPAFQADAFPKLVTAGHADDRLTLRKLTQGLVMHPTEDAVPLTNRSGSPDFLKVLVSTVPVEDLVSPPPVDDWDVTLHANTFMDAVEGLMRLCRDEPTFAHLGGCKSWSVKPTATFNCKDGTDAAWTTVHMYMSPYGDTDDGHEITKARLASVAEFTFFRMDEEFAYGDETKHEGYCLLRGPRQEWIRIFAGSGLTAQMCTLPHTDTDATTWGCLVSDVFMHDPHDDAHGDEPWTVATGATSHFTEDYFIRSMVSQCAGTPSTTSVPVSQSFCSCTPPLPAGDDNTCNGTYQTTNPQAAVAHIQPTIGPWDTDTDIGRAADRLAAGRPPVGALPTHGDVGVTRVHWGLRLKPGVDSPCVDPHTLQTPTIRHTIPVNPFTASHFTEPIIGTGQPVTSSMDLLDLAVQACATEAHSVRDPVSGGGWSCTGAAWTPAWEPGNVPDCEPDGVVPDPTLAFDVWVCTGPGGIVDANNTDVWTTSHDAWTPCSDEVPMDAPSLVPGVANVCLDCTCLAQTGPLLHTDTQYVAEYAHGTNVWTADCARTDSAHLSPYLGSILPTKSDTQPSAWSLVWDASHGTRQVANLWWDATVSPSGYTPLHKDFSTWSGKTYHTRVIRVTSDRDEVTIGSNMFYIQYPDDIVAAATAVCMQIAPNTTSAVSWRPLWACTGDVEPRHDPALFPGHIFDAAGNQYGVTGSAALVSVICDTNTETVFTHVDPSSGLDHVDTCPPTDPDSGLGATPIVTSPLALLRPGVVDIMQSTHAIPRADRHRWTAFPGFTQTTLRNAGVDITTDTNVQCPAYTGSWTPVRDTRLGECPGGGRTSSTPTHGTMPPIGHGGHIMFGQTPSSKSWVASSVWIGVASSCPHGTDATQVTTIKTIQDSAGFTSPLSVADLTPAIQIEDAAAACADRLSCTGIVVTAQIQNDWNPVTPNTERLSITWTVDACTTDYGDNPELDVDPTWSNDTLTYGLGTPHVWPGAAAVNYDPLSVFSTKGTQLASLSIDVCRTVDVYSGAEHLLPCRPVIPSQTTPRGEDTGPPDGVLEPSNPATTDLQGVDYRRLLTSCTRTPSRECACRQGYGPDTPCTTCTPAFPGGTLSETYNDSGHNPAYRQWAVDAPGVDMDAMDCQAYVANFCEPRGFFIDFGLDGDPDVPICNSTTCQPPWSGPSCTQCTHCSHTQDGIWSTDDFKPEATVCANTPATAQHMACNCTESPWFQKNPTANPTSGPDGRDERPCDVCKHPLAFAKPITKYRWSHWPEDTVAFGSFPGWCWAVLEQDAQTVIDASAYIDAGLDPPIPAGEFCHPTANVSASRLNNTCVYDKVDPHPRCFDERTPGCDNWDDTCLYPVVYPTTLTSNYSASVTAGRCECINGFKRNPVHGLTGACDTCADDAPYDRTLFAERACLGWPAICIVAGDGEHTAVPVDDTTTSITGCVCAYNDTTSVYADEPYVYEHCGQCGVGRKATTAKNTHTGLQQSWCPLLHPRVAAYDDPAYATVCSNGYATFDPDVSQHSEVCACHTGWTHTNESDPTSPCDVCAHNFVGPNCQPCPFDGACPVGTGPCFWDPEETERFDNGSATGRMGRPVCNCSAIHRDTWPLQPLPTTGENGCGPCLPMRHGDTCGPCAIDDCGVGGECSFEAGNVSQGVLAACKCNVGWRRSEVWDPWYQQPCGRCDQHTHVDAGFTTPPFGPWTSAGGESFEEGQAYPSDCAPCPTDCPNDCEWNTHLGGPACRCDDQRRLYVPRNVSLDERNATWDSHIDTPGFPHTTVWTCGDCHPDTPFGPHCVPCHSDCGGPRAAHCEWNHTTTVCVCSNGYIHTQPGNASSPCTTCDPATHVRGHDGDDGHITCELCPDNCPTGAPCQWNTHKPNATACHCEAVNRHTDTDTGSCLPGCASGFFPDSDDASTCNLPCPDDCGPHAMCAPHGTTRTFCHCDEGYTHAPGQNDDTPCTHCDDGYVQDPVSGTCHKCLAACPNDAPCVWSPSEGRARCDCASIHFLDHPVAVNGTLWTSCSSDAGCATPSHVGPNCDPCPPTGCGTNGTCVWQDTQPVCACDPGWTNTNGTNSHCDVCQPGMLPPRCTTCSGTCPPRTQCRYEPAVDDVLCGCVHPFRDVDNPVTGSNCTTCADGHVGPNCQPCPDCGTGTCAWNNDTGPMCVCPLGSRHTDRTNVSTPCSPCKNGETNNYCLQCAPNCTTTRGLGCYEITNIPLQRVVAVCSCLPGYVRLRDLNPDLQDCYSEVEAVFMRDYIFSSASATPSPSPVPSLYVRPKTWTDSIGGPTGVGVFAGILTAVVAATAAMVLGGCRGWPKRPKKRKSPKSSRLRRTTTRNTP